MIVEEIDTQKNFNQKYIKYKLNLWLNFCLGNDNIVRTRKKTKLHLRAFFSSQVKSQFSIKL